MSEPQIALPERIAAAVIDAVEWMVSEGQWFKDEAAGDDLMRYLLENHTDQITDWVKAAMSERIK